MKILLIQPPIRDFYQTRIRIQPIGLAYLAASLKENGYEPEILDCQAEQKKWSIPFPGKFSYLKEYYTPDISPCSSFYQFYHFGLSFGEIEEEIKHSGTRIFGISSLFTPYFGEAQQTAQIIKKIDKNNLVIVGGAHVSCSPEHVLRSPYVDYIILGEGEERLVRLLDCLNKG